MKALGIEYVITSPFLRCLQTSSEIVSAMGLTHGQWLLDWSMAEVRASHGKTHHHLYVLHSAHGEPG